MKTPPKFSYLASRLAFERFVSADAATNPVAAAPVALTPEGYEHLGFATQQFAAETDALGATGDPSTEVPAEDTAPRTPDCEFLPPETDRRADPNPYGFTPPPEGALCTMALVDWLNTETGETWTAPSGGYSPPSEAWVVQPPETDRRADPNPYGFTPPPEGTLCTTALVDWVNTETGETWTAPSGGYSPPSETWVVQEHVVVPDECVPVDPLPLPYVTFTQEPILAEDGTVLGYLDIWQWQQGDYSFTSVVEYDAAFNVVSTLHVDSTGYSAFSTYTSTTDDEGNVTGHEESGNWVDSQGNWGEYVNVFDASWQPLRNDYRDSWGNTTSTLYFYGEDGSPTGQQIHSTWIDADGVVAESITLLDASWRCLSTEYRDGFGTTVFTQYIYGETGELTALEITTTGVDENGEAWSDYTYQSLTSEGAGGIDDSELLPVTKLPVEEPVPEIIICEPWLPPPTDVDCELPPPYEPEPIPAEWLRPAELVGILPPEI